MFRRNIHAYNSMFAFTSMGANIDQSVNHQPGPYVFKINGHCHHLMGSLLSSDDSAPKFAQLYIYDLANEPISGKHQRVPMRAFYAYLIQEREYGEDTLIKGGRLYQQFLVDAFANIEEDRLDYIRMNQNNLRSDLIIILLKQCLKGFKDRQLEKLSSHLLSLVAHGI
uniref:Helitron helicase-like domain-containing protein n=1 Tax=Salix viminalis TaxID=40686 RepID=A0A6N2LZD0_SALVM